MPCGGVTCSSALRNADTAWGATLARPAARTPLPPKRMRGRAIAGAILIRFQSIARLYSAVAAAFGISAVIASTIGTVVSLPLTNSRSTIASFFLGLIFTCRIC